MKKLVNIAPIFCSIMIGSNLYAETVPTTITCPEKIVCTKDNDRSSCKQEGGSKNYWIPIQSDYYSDESFAGTYVFSFATSKYAFENHVSASNCYYKNEKNQLQISSIDGLFLEATFPKDVSTAWQIRNVYAECLTTDSPAKCPLMEMPGLSVNLWQLSAGFEISVNGTPITINDESRIHSPSYINYDSAVNYCGKSAKQCTFNISAFNNDKKVNVGNVIVDLSEHGKVKLLKVNPVPVTDLPEEIKKLSMSLKQIKSFNAIEFSGPDC